MDEVILRHNAAFIGTQGKLLYSRGYANATQGTISEAYNITSSRAGHDCVWSGNGLTMTDGGVVCNTSPNATVDIYTRKIQQPAVIGFEIRTGSVLYTGLTPNTTYYSRCYMVTSQGTFYSNEVVFTTLP